MLTKTNCLSSGDTTTYLYDAANRLQSINGVSVSYDNNGNLLTTGVMTNSWDSANQLIETTRAGSTLQPIYDGLGNRVGQTVGVSTTWYALDVGIGLPEVLYTSEGHKYLHLPGLILTENDTGEVRYLLSDGLGSVRHAVDAAGVVVAYREYSPYGEPVGESETGYGFTGEWWESEVGLLHLRARWYSPEHGVFLSRDPFEGTVIIPQSLNGYNYVHQNPVNWTDPSGEIAPIVIIIGGALIGGGIDLAYQWRYNDEINYAELGAATLAGAGGAAVGVAVGALEVGVGATIALNAVGSAAVSGVAKRTQNVWEGKCDVNEGVLTSALWGGVLGGVGAKIETKIIQKLKWAKQFDDLEFFTSSNWIDEISLLNKLSYLHNSYNPNPSGIGTSLGVTSGFGLANSSPFAPPIPTEIEKIITDHVLGECECVDQ